MALRIISALSSMRLSSQRLGAPSNPQRAFERLSSGQSITQRPSDVAIISTLKRDTRLATVALTNASTGVSLVSVADKALSEISTLLGKMYSLADAGAKTSFLSIEERSAMQREYTEMASQIQEISTSTTFNGFNPLGSTSANVVFQVGIDDTSSSRLALSASGASLEELGLASTGSGELKHTLTNKESSRSAAELVAGALADIDTKRSAFAAMGDRLEVSIANLSSTRDGIAAAEAGIKEASEMDSVAEKSRSQIIQDAGEALLAQANQQPLSVARLLEGSSADSSNNKDSQIGGIQASTGAAQGPLQRDDGQFKQLFEELKKR